MATLRQIIDAAVVVETEAEKLDALVVERDRLVAVLQDTRDRVSAQQVIVNQRVAELKALL